jgi:hypothetical protein
MGQALTYTNLVLAPRHEQKQLVVGAMVGVALVGLVVVSICYVQLRLKSADLGHNHLANQQTSTPKPTAAGAAERTVPDDLRFCRWLVSKDKVAVAVKYYEAYLQRVPPSVGLRTELISVYVATKNNQKARRLCLQTLKSNPTSSEIATIWQFLGQCQTD